MPEAQAREFVAQLRLVVYLAVEAKAHAGPRVEDLHAGRTGLDEHALAQHGGYSARQTDGGGRGHDSAHAFGL